MKKLILTLALIVTTAAYTMQAQRVSVSINIGSQPSWGPVGCDYVDYYYMPDIDCYYSVNQGLFFYLNAGRWVGVRYLPYTYRDYDFYSMYKVVLVGHDPWLHNNRHRRMYARYRGYRTQPVIRYSRDVRYRNSRNNDVIWYDRRDNRDNRRSSNDRRDDSRYNNGRSDRVDNNRDYNKKYDRNRNDSRRQSDNRRSQGTSDRSEGRSRSSKSDRSSDSYYTQTSSRGGDRTSNSSRSRTSSTQSSRSSSSRSDRR